MTTRPSPLHSPDQNQLLAALPADDFAAIAEHLERVPMPLGHMLYEPGTQLRHAYFPTTCIVSLHYVTESGASAETAGVGNEGVVGVSLYMGGETQPPARRWCKQPVTRTGWTATCYCKSSSVRVLCSVCCCATPKR